MLYKDPYYGHSPIRSVWEEAQKELSHCERLVVIGYSFPPADFHVKKLLIDALFAETSRSWLSCIAAGEKVPGFGW